VKVTYGSSGGALTLTYYYILNTYSEAQREEADAYAERVSSLLKRPVDVLPDPRATSSNKLAVLFGPLTTAEKNAIERAVKQAFPSAELYRPSSGSGGSGNVEARDARGRVLVRTSGFIGFRPKQRDGLTRVRHIRESYCGLGGTGHVAHQRQPCLSGDDRGVGQPQETPLDRQPRVPRALPLRRGAAGNRRQRPFEMKKVQAVISRSEVIAKLRMHRHDGWHYDMCDQQCCQVYKGALVESPDSNAAVEATWGQVCVYGDNIADAVYSHSCGGVTAGSEDVWGGEAKAYLRSTMDSAAYKEQPALSGDEAARRFLSSNAPCFCNPNRKGSPIRKKAVSAGRSPTRRRLWRNNRVIRRAAMWGGCSIVRVVTRAKSGRVKRLDVATSNKGVVSLTREMSIGALENQKHVLCPRTAV
jgi:hypothetical protein